MFLASISEKTLKQYDSVFSRWWKYCNNQGQDPLSFHLKSVISFLTTLVKKGLSYSSINTHKSALSLIIDIPDNQQYIFKRFLKGIYSLHPPKPKYSFTWDTSVVIKYLENLYPLETLSLEKLSYKLVMLLALTSAHRLQTLSLIKIDNICIKPSVIEITIPDNIKTSGKNKHQPILSFPFFKEKPQLCVGSIICHYINITKSVRPESEKRLILTTRKPYKAASTQTLSKWLKKTLELSGIDTNVFKGYSTRHAATSAAVRAGLNIEIIRKTAGWSEKSLVFNKFYNKPLLNDTTNFAKTILTS